MMKKIFILLLLLFISLTSFSQRAAEFKNGITIQKEEVLASKFVSYGESYINNWRDLVLDLGATYFPNNGGYEIGRLHQLGETPSLHFIPAAVGEGVIYSIGKNRVNDLDVSNSASTYVDEDGIIQTAAIDFARIDYTDGDGVILAEPQGINFITFSEDFTQWVAQGSIVVTVNNIIAPDGTLTGTKIENLIDGESFFKATSGHPNSTRVEPSIFIKKITQTGILIVSNPYGAQNEWEVDLSLLSNEWERITRENLAVTIIAENFSSASGDSGVLLTAKSGDLDVYAWGGQIEDLEYSTSYIKSNSGSTTTRLVDLVADAGDVNSINSTEGVLFVEMAAFANDLTGRKIGLGDGTGTNQCNISFSSTTQSIAYLIYNGSVQASGIINVGDITDFHKIALKWSQDDFALWIDGIEVATDSSGDTFGTGVLTVLSFASGAVFASSNPFYGKIRQIKVFKTALSDDELKALTCKDSVSCLNVIPFLLIGFRRRNQYKNAA